jgi:hypothetical protein
MRLNSGMPQQVQRRQRCTGYASSYGICATVGPASRGAMRVSMTSPQSPPLAARDTKRPRWPRPWSAVETVNKAAWVHHARMQEQTPGGRASMNLDQPMQCASGGAVRTTTASTGRTTLALS